MSHRLSPAAQVLAESHADLHPLVDELLAALNVTGARRVHPVASRARTLADLARGHRAAGVAADRLVLPCRTPPIHPQLWRRARPCLVIRSGLGLGSSYCMPQQISIALADLPRGYRAAHEMRRGLGLGNPLVLPCRTPPPLLLQLWRRGYPALFHQRIVCLVAQSIVLEVNLKALQSV